MRKFLSAAGLCLASVLLTGNTKAAINLPPGPVTVTATEGNNSFMDLTLSGVPSGFTVGNNTYLGWCVEAFNTNNPAVGYNVHQALLLSSLGNDLGAFSGLPWDKINYVLNHKQGTPRDIQFALWNLTDGVPVPDAHPTALQIVNAANANGSGFVPTGNQVTAALVAWLGQSQTNQGTIIECPPPTDECADRFTAGGFIFVGEEKATFGIQGGIQNGRLWGGINYIDHNTGMHVRGRTTTSYTVIDEFCRRATYDVTINGVAGTATVIVCDFGEPGRTDTLNITLSTGYSASGDLANTRPGGGNVQLHKPKCNEVEVTRTGKPSGKPSGKPTRPSSAK